MKPAARRMTSCHRGLRDLLGTINGATVRLHQMTGCQILLKGLVHERVRGRAAGLEQSASLLGRGDVAVRDLLGLQVIETRIELPEDLDEASLELLG